MNHNLGYFYDGHALPLCNPIGIIFLGGVLSSIVRPLEHLNFITCLTLHKRFKLLKLIEGFILGFHKVKPSFPRGIINERNIINVTY